MPPASSPGALVDVLLRRAVDQTRYENATVRALKRRLRPFLTQVVDAVRASGLYDKAPERGGVLGLLDRQERLGALLTGIATRLRGLVGELSQRTQDDLRGFAELELLEVPPVIQGALDTAQTQAVQEAAGDVPEVFQQVPVGQMAELLTSPLGGANFVQSFIDLATQTLMALRNVLQQGLLQGQGVAEVARGVRRVLQKPTWQAERIVRSEFVRVAGQAAVAQFQQNKNLLKGVRWVATLDKATCMQCAALDGRTWTPPSKALRPVVHTHPNCRCILVPIIKGLPGVVLPAGTRASMTGQVPATQTYPTWFRQQTPGFQQDVLGPTRYRLYRSGALALKDFSTASGTRSVADALALARSRA